MPKTDPVYRYRLGLNTFWILHIVDELKEKQNSAKLFEICKGE